MLKPHGTCSPNLLKPDTSQLALHANNANQAIERIMNFFPISL